MFNLKFAINLENDEECGVGCSTSWCNLVDSDDLLRQLGTKYVIKPPCTISKTNSDEILI